MRSRAIVLDSFHMERPIRLDRLAEELRVPRVTAWRWHVHGDVQGDNQRSGRGKGIRLSRDEALEFCAIALLRTARVPMPRVRAIVEQLRAEGKRGAAFLKAGAGPGGSAALDGRGPNVPLFELAGGQGVLFPKLDLRTVEGRINRLLDKLEAEAAAAEKAGSA